MALAVTAAEVATSYASWWPCDREIHLSQFKKVGWGGLLVVGAMCDARQATSDGGDSAQSQSCTMDAAARWEDRVNFSRSSKMRAARS